MQSVHALPSEDVDLDTNKRWQAWRARGATADRAMARTMTRSLVVIFVALSAWLAFQLLS
jgi:hypothetical protein